MKTLVILQLWALLDQNFCKMSERPESPSFLPGACMTFYNDIRISISCDVCTVWPTAVGSLC